MNTYIIIFVASTFACGLLHAADTTERKVVAESATEQIVAPKVAAVIMKSKETTTQFRSSHGGPVAYHSAANLPTYGKPGFEDLLPGCGDLSRYFG
jgi:hypothetical protein